MELAVEVFVGTGNRPRHGLPRQPELHSIRPTLSCSTLIAHSTGRRNSASNSGMPSVCTPVQTGQETWCNTLAVTDPKRNRRNGP